MSDGERDQSGWRRWLRGFRRITSSGDYLPEIDGLRFIAIILVVLYHVALYSSVARKHEQGLYAYARFGVELFFAISGFILALPFALHHLGHGKKVSIRKYFLRRITRLEPPYLLSLVLLTILKVTLRGDEFTYLKLNLFWSALYLHGWANGYTSFINGVAWSLEVEVQFYLLMPLLSLLFFISNRWLRRAIIVSIAIAAISVQPVFTRGYFTGYTYERHLLNYLQYFLAGLMLADVYVTEWRGAPPAIRSGGFGWGDCIWLAGWPLAFLVLVTGGVTARALFPVIIFGLYVALFYSVLARRLMRVPVLTVLGGMCYSIYLLHSTVIEAAGRLSAGWLPTSFHATVFALFLYMAPLLLVICGVYFRLIERPCMRSDWPARLWHWLMRHLFVEEDEQTSSTPPAVPVATTIVDRDAPPQQERSVLPSGR